jgi:hypothetical protein
MQMFAEQSRSVVRGSIRKSYFFPFTRKVTGIASFDSDDIDCSFSGRFPSAGPIGPADANKLAMPKRDRKVRRVRFPKVAALSVPRVFVTFALRGHANLLGRIVFKSGLVLKCHEFHWLLV